MMALHSFDDFFACTKFLENSLADFDVCSGYFMIYGFTNIVEERTRFGHRHVGAHFLGNHTGNV